MRRQILVGCTALLVLLVSSAACSSGSDSPSTFDASSSSTTPTTAAQAKAKATTTTTAPPNGVNPNAPEQNAPGDIPDNQVFVPYAPPGAAYTLEVPEGWSRRTTRGATTFTDNFNSIHVESRPAARAPTLASMRSVDLPVLAKVTPGYAPGTLEPVTRKAGPVIRITYGADSPVNQVTRRAQRLDVERYVFWHNGTEVVLTLSGAKGADNVDPWRIVTDSVTFKA